MSREKFPVTPAIRALRAAGVAFEGHLYEYVERGGTAVSAAALGVEEHRVIKTLVMETDAKAPLVVLMHGDREVSTRGLARAIGARSIQPCSPDAAHKHTGYLVGGTSPFGTKKELPVYMQSTITGIERILLNGGKRGFLVELATADAVALLRPTLVDVATE
jgi:Cys-tRNA(Pro) deacylase